MGWRGGLACLAGAPVCQGWACVAHMQPEALIGRAAGVPACLPAPIPSFILPSCLSVVQDDSKLYKNNEIANLIVGLGLGLKGEDAVNLRYGKVCSTAVQLSQQ